MRSDESDQADFENDCEKKNNETETPQIMKHSLVKSDVSIHGEKKYRDFATTFLLQWVAMTMKCVLFYEEIPEISMWFLMWFFTAHFVSSFASCVFCHNYFGYETLMYLFTLQLPILTLVQKHCYGSSWEVLPFLILFLSMVRHRDSYNVLNDEIKSVGKHIKNVTERIP